MTFTEVNQNEIVAEVRSRGAEALRAATALAGGLAQLTTPVERARSLPCPQCWSRPGRACTFTGPDGDHLARYLDAEKASLITRDELKAVIAGLDVIADHAIVRGAS